MSRWKTLGVLGITVLSLLYLIPSVVPEEQQPPWFRGYFTKKIQLGLDLQGGLHLVYEPDMQKAVSDKADRIAGDVEEKLKKDKKISDVVVDREGERDIVVRFKDPKDLKLVDRDFLMEYKVQLAEVSKDEAKGELRYAVDTDYIDQIKDDAIRQAIEKVNGRVDEFGVAEPTIVRKGEDIVIELPGLKESDFERIKRVIGRTAQLEFKIVDDSEAANEYMKSIAALVPKESGIEVAPDSWPVRDSNEEHSMIYFHAKTKEALEKFFGSLPADKPVPAANEIGYEEITPRDEMKAAAGERSWRAFLLRRRTDLTGEHLNDAYVGADQQTNRPEVNVSFDREGAGIIERVSGENIGRKMAIILDRRITSAPVIESRLGANIRITLGSYGDPMRLHEEAKDLVAVLKAGSLPVPLRKTFETKVGRTLGDDAVEKAKTAMLIGALAVVLFMLLYYRGAGLIADLAMILNMLYMIAILAGFEATLTLPGIAGLVLTIGMAVDANIIIYERIREELRAGKSPRSAVDAGFNRAFWTVFDAHITNLIAGVVLYSYGSGPVRGFAVTLIIGVITNLFTSVWVSRGMFGFVLGRKRQAVTLSI